MNLPVPQGTKLPFRCSQKRKAMTGPLLSINDEKRPDIARLVIGAEKALHALHIFRNQKNCLLLIPIDFGIPHQSRVEQTVFRCAVTDLPNPGPITCGAWADMDIHCPHSAATI